MAQVEGRSGLGVALVLLATLLFAAGDTLMKHLTALWAVPLILMIRSLVTISLLGVALGPAQGAGLWRTRRTGLVILRGLCLAAASLTMGLALRLMPVGETVAIIYLAPFAVMLLARSFLKEEVPVLGWAGAVVAFAGVLVILRPGSGLDPWGVALSVMNAGLATLFHLLTRILSRTETTHAMTFHTATTGFAVFAVMVAFAPPPVWPGPAVLLQMGVLGALTTGGHFLFASAYWFAGAAVLAPVNYMHVVWAAAFGWLVFSHQPDGLTAGGMALVVLGGAAVALRAGRRLPD